VSTVAVAASMNAGEDAGKPPTKCGASGVVPRRWEKMDLRNKGTSAWGEPNMTMVQRRVVSDYCFKFRSHLEKHYLHLKHTSPLVDHISSMPTRNSTDTTPFNFCVRVHFCTRV
jgi:hypothetical protein